MDRTGFQDWLNRYIAAWRSYDRAEIESLFAPDARYWYGPYREPTVGATTIADEWLEEPDEAGTWEAEYWPIAIDGDTYVANGESRYLSDNRAYNNIFVCSFDEAGRCTEFREWYMERKPATA